MNSYQYRIKSLVKKYLNNNCTVEEIEELFEYSKTHPEDTIWEEAIDLNAQNEILANEELPISELTSRSMRLSVLSRLQAKKYFNLSTHHWYTNHFFKVAAIFLMVAVCLGVFYFSSLKSNEIIIRTSFGEIRRITLPDNSLVVLNANSELKYNKTWTANEIRTVYLKGEAFFNVIHHINNQKFQVHTSTHVQINVLGTEFNVNDRRDRTQITLQSGNIRLNLEEVKNLHDSTNVVMHPGEYVAVDDARKTLIRKKKIDSNVYTSWKSKQFIFKETALRDILYVLEDNYGVEAIVKDSLVLQETFTATYPAHNVDVLLKALSKSFKITFKTSKNDKRSRGQ